MKKQTMFLVVGISIIGAIQGEEVNAAPRLGPAVAAAGRGVRAGFSRAKSLIVTCAGYDAVAGSATPPPAAGSPGAGQRTGCVQTVVTQLRETVNGLGEVTGGGLEAWCNGVQDLDGAVSECKSTLEKLREPATQTMLREARENDFIQLLRTRANSLQGSATSAGCRRQARELRECLLGISQAFANGAPGTPEPAPQPPAQTPAR